MARKAREVIPGQAMHIVARGRAISPIFLSDELQKILLLAYICSLFFVINYTINSVGALVRSGIYKFDEHIKKSSNEQ